MKKLLSLAAVALCALFTYTVFAAVPVNVGWTYAGADVVTYGVTVFSVERKTEACAGTVAPWGEITQAPNNVRAFTDIAVTPGTTYCYRVFAIGTAGKALTSPVAEKTVIGPPPPVGAVTAT